MSTESNEIPTEVKEEAIASEPFEPVSQEPKPKSKEYNFRRMESKLQEMESKLRAVEEEKARLYQGKEDPAYDDSDLVTAGQMKKLIAQEAKRIANETVMQRDLETLGDRLEAKFKDFNEVVSEDAIDELKHEHPEIFATLRSNPDPYSKGLAAYKIIKSMKGDVKTKEAGKANEKKLEENRSKPNVAAANASVLSQATGWTKPSKEMKQNLYQEMKQAASKRS